MNSYLSLVSQYAKVHKKKNRLTIICITLSVMLITAIFGMADMSLNAQINESIRRYGNWHAILTGISEDTAEAIAGRSDVNVSSWFGMAEKTAYQGKELIVQGSSEALAKAMNLTVKEGRYPVAPNEALLDRQGLEQFALAIGNTIEIAFSDGEARSYTITGTFGDYSTLKGTDAHGLQLSVEGMRALPTALYSEYYYIQFGSGVNINSALAEMKQTHELTDEQVSTNVMLLGLMGQSKDTTMLEVYLTATILFVLVALAGTFMIASSFNMSILERTQFFGLLRCLGATKKQVKRYIRLEGLLYCVKAIPIGLLLGCAVQWVVMFILNELNSQYLPVMPEFRISWLGLLAGAVIGILVVMIASNSPAKKAAKVSPQAAVTGNLGQTNNQPLARESNTKRFPVDIAMGLNHAFSNKKSMTLITGSFAISIILFLCFSILITFMNHALSPLKPYAPDLSVESAQADGLLEPSLMDELKSLPGVETAYARMYMAGIPASAGQNTGNATLISYDGPQFEWARNSLISGNIEDAQSGYGVLVDYGYSQEYNWQVGDTITLTVNGAPREVQVAGIVSDAPVDSEGGWLVICSESTFIVLTGITGYKAIDMQVSGDISAQVRSLLTADMKLLDLQQRNNEVRTGYLAMAVFIYGFLVVIALVALINIVNTVNASVSGRMGNYGVMRAVGMSARQLKKVVRAEAAAYAVTGSIVGAVSGTLMHRFFFGMLITGNWGQPWQPPIAVLTVTIAASILTTFIAVISPARKIEGMSIVNVVNAG